MPGLSEDNPPGQMTPTSTPLVPHFLVLLLDLLKVPQQLCIVVLEELLSVSRGLPSDHLWEERAEGSVSLSQHMWGLLDEVGQRHRLVELTLGESVCLRPSNPSPTTPKC